jgi:hypothetical protein
MFFYISLGFFARPADSMMTPHIRHVYVIAEVLTTCTVEPLVDTGTRNPFL